MVAPGRDVVLVPIVLLDELGQFGRVAELLDDLGLVVLADHRLLAALGQDAAVVFAVADARVVIVAVHVGLVAVDAPLLLFSSQLRIWMPELAKPGLGMRNSILISKSAGLPPRQMRNVLRCVGFSFVVWPVMQPSSTRQNLGSPSQPSSVLPSKIGTESVGICRGRFSPCDGKGHYEEHSQTGINQFRRQFIGGSPERE